MRWAVSMRTRRPSGKAFEKAYNDGRIIRTHLLRTTWQLLAGEDLGWMLKLCRRKALAGLRGWMHANGVDIPAEEEKRISGIFGEALAGHGSVQKEFLAEALRERDIQMTEQRFSYHLRLAELSGLLCSGDLHPTKRTLALAAEKVRNSLVLSHEEALALLTRKYFRSHSPATLEDFVWWRAPRRALERPRLLRPRGRPHPRLPPRQRPPPPRFRRIPHRLQEPRHRPPPRPLAPRPQQLRHLLPDCRPGRLHRGQLVSLRPRRRSHTLRRIDDSPDRTLPRSARHLPRRPQTQAISRNKLNPWRPSSCKRSLARAEGSMRYAWALIRR